MSRPIRNEDGSPIRQLRPKRLEVGIVFHETSDRKLVQRLGHGDVNGVPVSLELAVDNSQFFISILDKPGGRSVYRYKLTLHELAGALIATHFKDYKLRPDPEAGSELPMLLGIPFDPYKDSEQE